MSNRAERRRQARAAAKRRTLFHGTAAALVAEIERDGLKVGQEGRVYLTDSRAIARSYAVWETAQQLALGNGQAIGAVLTVTVPGPLTVERDSFPPPLPWETTMLSGVSYFTTEPITPAMIASVKRFEIEELRDEETLEAVIAEHELVCAAVPRSDAIGSAAPLIARSGLHDAIPDHWALLDAVIAASPNARSRWHGESHWLGVLAAAVRLLERGSRADPAVLLAFCVLHDSLRRSEGHDPKHGERAAAFADRLHPEHLRLSARQRELLRRALVDHDRGLTTRAVTIGACWDADRLTLPRVGITINPRMLSTAQGRQLACAPDSVPEPAACDWDWALSRMYLLASRGRAVASRRAAA